MNCKLCGKKLTGNRRKFCCNKHKDRYHNINNPRGKFAHLNPNNFDEDYRSYEDDHPCSSEVLGQW